MVIEKATDITSLLHSRYLIPEEQKNILIEHNKTQDGEEFDSIVKLRQIDKDIEYVTYRFEDKSCNEKLPELFPFFEHEMGLRKNCDYIIFACNKFNFYFLLFELKLYNSSNKPKEQLDSSRIFVDFVQKRIENAGHTYMFPTEVRMIGIRDPQRIKSCPKGYTRAEDYEYDDGYLEICGDGKTRQIPVFIDALLK